MDDGPEGITMTRSKHSLTRRTRYLAGDPLLEEDHGALLSVMMLLAGIADDVEGRAVDRRLAAVEWMLKWDELNSRVAQKAKEASWSSRRPKAV